MNKSGITPVGDKEQEMIANNLVELAKIEQTKDKSETG